MSRVSLHPRPRFGPSVLIAAALVCALPAGAAGQASVHVRVAPPVVYGVAELAVRVPIQDRVHATVALDLVEGSSACTEGEVYCGYFGRTLSLGPSIDLMRSGPLLLAGRGRVGWFRRTGSLAARSGGWDRLALDLGVDARLQLWRALGLSAGLTRRWVVDDGYVEAHGHGPRFTFAAIGVDFAFERK